MYEFVCEHCKFHGLTEQSIKEPLPQECPDCGGRDPDFHQVFGDPFCFIRQAPSTFGQQAEINAKRMGKEYMQKLVEQSQEANHKGQLALKIPKRSQKMKDRYRPARPWWRPTQDKPLDVSKISNVKRFIEEGKS